MNKYILSWFLLLFAALLNAAIRELAYKDFFEEHLSHQISVFTGLLLISIPILYISKKWPFKDKVQAFQVGLIWCFMTDLFEFLMFLRVSENPYKDFLKVHNIFAGEFWILILIWLIICPVLFYRSNSKSIKID
ncbi:hypothetical protein [Leptospira licerasiae]|uniref:DUF2809 domain-containing protein n=1 Tax=Leptospira licerasiae str. MMD4847 TaxID=1049971 RepID=A0ABN0H437_9LEPT|nr:hypothetical protein [Leptospira licerasiae]EIE00554.1 hypothetical protein LEP1GSC185_0231 [Leptospira licerasiae serovar Varillal str. VAR 010]EJZ40468.1 hypothetical protein LEP1GSC178_1914 [Leptospira licerasiae str. MMD4847]